MILFKINVFMTCVIVLLSLNGLSATIDDDLPSTSSTQYTLMNEPIDPPEFIDFFEESHQRLSSSSDEDSPFEFKTQKVMTKPTFTNIYAERIKCKEEINVYFKENLTPEDHVRRAITNLTKFDDLNYYVMQYYLQFGRFMRIGGIPSVSNYCFYQVYKGQIIEVNYGELEPKKSPTDKPKYVARSTLSSESFDIQPNSYPNKRIKFSDDCTRSIKKVFRAESPLNTMIAALYYLKDKTVQRSKELYAIRYFATIHRLFELKIDPTFKTPSKLCDSLITKPNTQENLEKPDELNIPENPGEPETFINFL